MMNNSPHRSPAPRPRLGSVVTTVKELGRLMTARPTDPVVRAHEMGIYRPYFNLIATGRKITEIRVNDSSRKKIKEGALIRFRCQGDAVLTRVTKVARYTNFEEMFDHESISSVNPLATRDEQLANIRQIYPPRARSPRCRGHRHRAGRPASTGITAPLGGSAGPHTGSMRLFRWNLRRSSTATMARNLRC